MDLFAEEVELAKRCVACSGSPVVFFNSDVYVKFLSGFRSINLQFAGLIGLLTWVNNIVENSSKFSSLLYFLTAWF